MRYCLRTRLAIFFVALFCFCFAGSGQAIARIGSDITPALPSLVPETTEKRVSASGAPDPTLGKGMPAPAITEGGQAEIMGYGGVCPRQIGTIVQDKDECRLLNSTLKNVDFFGISANLTSESKTALDAIAEVINANPAVIVEIRAHTESFDDPTREERLSAQRALAVAQHLVLNGVQVVRLRAKAFGATVPATESETSSDSPQNERIELRALRP